MGECWLPHATPDGIPQVKISPNLEDPVEVLAVHIHELVHVVRPDAGHGSEFRAVAVALGLTGPMTSTRPRPDLKVRLEQIAAELGPYPHRRLGPAFEISGADGTHGAALPPDEPVDSPKRQHGSRMLKLACPCCGYSARTTRKWIEMGRPLCPIDGYALQEIPTPERRPQGDRQEVR